MKLFFAPGACSFAVHLALRETGSNFSAEKVDLRTKTYSGGDYTAVNPKGSVPALQLNSGETLTETAVLLQYVADQNADKNLFPKWGSVERYQAMSWLNFLATEVHKSFGPMWAAKFSGQSNPEPAVQHLQRKLGLLDERMQKNPWLLGAQYSIADMYMFTLLSWTTFLNIDISKFKSLLGFMEKMNQKPTVQEAQKAEHH